MAGPDENKTIRILMLEDYPVDSELVRFKLASHKLRHPITVIKGYTEMLDDGGTEIPEDMVSDIYSSMNGAADRLTRVVTELMDVSRIESAGVELDMTPCDIKELVLEAVAGERGGSAARQVEAEVLSDPGEVKVDRARFMFVLEQLLDSASTRSRMRSTFRHDGRVVWKRS